MPGANQIKLKMKRKQMYPVLVNEFFLQHNNCLTDRQFDVLFQGAKENVAAVFAKNNSQLRRVSHHTDFFTIIFF